MSAERDRLYDLLISGSGTIHTRQPDLEREATERAFEARQQVGLDGSTPISHPTQAEMEARLGPEWSGKGTGELATWNYLYRDPVKAAADGLLNSPTHRAVLDDPSYIYWGAGIYTELPPSTTDELQRRWYFIIWLSKGVPPVSDKFTDIADSEFRNDINFLAERKIVAGIPNPDGTFRYEPDANVTRGQMAAFLARILRAEDKRDPS